MSTQEIIDGLTDQLYSNGDVDYIWLSSGIEFVSKVANTILSIMVAILVIGTPLIVSLELAYINFPIIQSKLGGAIDKTTGRTNKILRFTLRDGIRASERAAEDPDRNVNIEYMKLKFWTIFITTLIIAMALGGASVFINFMVRILQGPIDVITDAMF